MKKLSLILFSLISMSSSAYDSLYGDIFVYAGLSVGSANLSTSVSNDGGDKSGLASSLSVSGTYFQSNWLLNFGLGYCDFSLKNDTSNIELVTQTAYLDFTPMYRFNNRFSLGPSYQITLGEEILLAPSSALNVNNAQTTNNMAGLVLNYEIPVKSFRMRLGASVHKALDVDSRDLYVSMFRIEFGARVYDNKNEHIKVIHKNTEIIKLVPAEIIVLNEEIINFERGSYNLSEKSELFLRDLAKLLKENLKDWELIRIIGHTDSVGPSDKNQVLSKKRASSFEKILLSENISRERVYSLGMGESQLKSKGLNNDDHRLNRRVEIQFIGKLNTEFVKKIRELIRKSSL